MWNVTASVPVGLYAVRQARLKRGDLLILRLPPDVEARAAALGIIPSGVPIIKPVAALAGDLVCRFGEAVFINDRQVAVARRRDEQGRCLPTWRGCFRLERDAVFLLAPHPSSFDSRYYGPVPIVLVQGIAHPLLTVSE